MATKGIHLYPSAIVNASRLERITTSLQSSAVFNEVHIVGRPAAGLEKSQQVADGVEIRRVGRRPDGPESKPRKAVALALWCLSVYRAYARVPLTCVSAHSVWMLPLARLISVRTGAVLAYNPHELETEGATMGRLRKPLAQMVERTLLRRCAVVSVVNSSIADWYTRRYGRPDVLAIRNIPMDARPATRLRDDLGISHDELLFIHTGHLGGSRSIDRVLSTFARHPDRHVVFLGDGALGPDVRSAAQRHANIHWHAPVAPDAVVGHVREADAALVLIQATCLSYKLSSPNKLFEALAARTPPICTDLPEARKALGTESDDWILASVDDLDAAVVKMDRSRAETFRSGFPGLPSWHQEVAPLVAAYRRAVEAGAGR